MYHRKRDAAVYIADILDAIRKIESYTEHINYGDFELDEMRQDAVVRNFEVIGEAAKNIPGYFKKQHPGIAWDKITGMRNKLIHEYFGISLPIVWETVQTDLPVLKDQISQCVRRT